MANQEGLLPFKLVEDDSGEALTSFGGLPLVVETYEALGLPGSVKRHVQISSATGAIRSRSMWRVSLR